MLTLETTTQFRRDYKLAKKRGYQMELLGQVIDLLLAEEPLPPRYRDHSLSGSLAKYRECHIQPDWLFIYRKEAGRLILLAHRTGTHSDLFDL